MLELLLNDPLFRQIAAPIALAILGYLMRKLQISLTPLAVEARVSQSVSAPPPPNGNGYNAAIHTTNQRVSDIRDDMREDLRAMKAEIMDKINWLSIDLHEGMDAQNIRIARLERTVASLVPHDSLGSTLLREAKRDMPTPSVEDVKPVIEYKPAPDHPTGDNPA